MDPGLAGNDLERLIVSGLIGGKPAEVEWTIDGMEGTPSAVAAVRDYVMVNRGDFIPTHPEGGAFEVGVDHYDNAYATIPMVFDVVAEVDGIDPTVDEADDGDTTVEMAESWRPSLHPRWPRGTPKGGKFMTKGEIAAAKKAGGPQALAAGASRNASGSPAGARRTTAATPAGAGPVRMKDVTPLPLPKNPDAKGAMVTHSPKEAARLLGEGKAVRLKSTRQVAVLLDELAAIVADAESRGEKAPNYDLCKVTVENTSLFCVESKGIPRIQMPQLKGIPEAGTRADKLPKDKKGEVDLTAGFLKHLQKGGYKTTDTEENAAFLKASQNELNGAKVAGMVKWMRGGGDPNSTSRMLVSEDNYIVDGHHRWAATVGLDAEDGRLGNDKAIPITKIDIDIIKLLREAVLYANNQGIPNAGWTVPSAGARKK